MGLLYVTRVCHLLHLLEGESTVLQMLINHEVSHRFRKELGTTVHSSVAVQRVDNLLFYQFSPVFYFCFPVATLFLEVGSGLETFLVFSPFPLPRRTPLGYSKDSRDLHTLKICMCCFHFVWVGYE